MSRGIQAEGEEATGDLTEYVVTRWYRAPEIMLSCQVGRVAHCLEASHTAVALAPGHEGCVWVGFVFVGLVWARLLCVSAALGVGVHCSTRTLGSGRQTAATYEHRCAAAPN